MDYELLLKKYIEYIVDTEGTDCISIHDSRYQSDVEFSNDEWDELVKLADKSATGA